MTKFRLWGPLWRDWICSIDHKKIGIMYMILGLVMFLRGFADAAMMRLQQAMAFGDNLGYLPPHHYDQIFTAHGVIMIFFVAMPFVTGLMNYLVPLQIGARDVSFPFLNNFSFWMTTAGAVLVMISLFLGEFSTSGWLALSNLGTRAEAPGWITTSGPADRGCGHDAVGYQPDRHHHQDARPGMNLMKMPVFTWTSLCTNALIVASFPVLTAALVLMSLDRYLGTTSSRTTSAATPCCT
jgi:cytochrome o ubiquinol oxidase subunit 1